MRYTHPHPDAWRWRDRHRTWFSYTCGRRLPLPQNRGCVRGGMGYVLALGVLSGGDGMGECAEQQRLLLEAKVAPGGVYRVVLFSIRFGVCARF